MAKKCTYCESGITIGDGVVCPNCKNPYHKWCWEEIGQCVECGFIKDPIKVQNLQEKEKAEQERFQARLNHLKATGRDGYYEYKVISMVDKKGAVDTERLMAELNDLGLDGWRLQCAYTNEMGKDALTIAGFGLNSTADQNILILERFVKFE